MHFQISSDGMALSCWSCSSVFLALLGKKHRLLPAPQVQIRSGQPLFHCRKRKRVYSEFAHSSFFGRSDAAVCHLRFPKKTRSSSTRSPHLALAHFFLFTKIKSSLKRHDHGTPTKKLAREPLTTFRNPTTREPSDCWKAGVSMLKEWTLKNFKAL